MVSPANETGMCETLINVKYVKKSKMQKFRFSESKAKVMFFSATNSQLASGMREALINVKSVEKSKMHVMFSSATENQLPTLKTKRKGEKEKGRKKCKL